MLYSDKNLNSTATADLTPEMSNLTSDILLQSGFNKYEISNYSQPGYECRHNLDTWFGGKYLGLGPTASSFDGTNRWTQSKLNEWLKGERPQIDCLSQLNRTIEIFIMGLRTTRGWIIKHIENKKILLTSQFPQSLELNTEEWGELNIKLSSLTKAGLLKIKNIANNKMQVSPTEKGLLFWDEIALQLI